MRQLLAVALLALTTPVTSAVHAQTTPTTVPAPVLAFEVAAIKENKGTEMGRSIRRQPGGRFNVTNMPLQELIRFAYQMQMYQIEGLPEWARSVNWDIVAKAETDPPPAAPGTPDQLMLMLRTLLADRFKLAIRHDTRESDVWELRLARADRRPGPALKPASVDCVAMAERMRKGEQPPPPPTDPNTPRPCTIGIGPGAMLVGGFPMSQLSNALGTLVGRRVVDRTELPGNYEFVLKYAPDSVEMPGLPPPPGPPPPSDTSAPSLFTALQEQLGLKLEAARGPVEFLVVERAERPTED
jgi:uncharacterized protein (TIGR03435 family)